MKKKVSLFLLLTFITFMILPTFNFYVDIARVFSKDYKRHYQGQLSNELFLQSMYLLDHPEMKKIIFGSSRIGNGLDLQSYDSWYKAWHQGASLVEHEKTLQYVLSRNKKIEEVIIAIDYLSFFSTAKDDYFRINPPLNFKDYIKFYKFYIYRTPSYKDFKAFFKNDLVPNRKHIFSKIGNDTNKSQKYFMNQNMFQKKRKVHHFTYNKNLLALKNIKKICQDNHIKFSFFIQPFHYKNLLAQDPTFTKKYKKDLLSISNNYLDCSKLTDYTINNKYWVDVSHYNTHLGNLLLDTIISEANNSSSICTKLNEKDIQKDFIKEKGNIYNILPSLIQSDMKVIPHKNYYPNKIFSKKINSKTQSLQIKLPDITCGNDNLHVLINLETFKETNVHIKYKQLNNKTYLSDTQLFTYNGWPKVDNQHSISLIIHCPILKKSGFIISSDKKILIQDIQVYKKDK